MKIEGLGQYNPQTAINASKQVSEEASFSSALQKAYDEQDKAKIKEVCVEFETIMLKSLYTQMKATVMKSDLTEESTAREIFQDMLDDELMKQGATKGIGIAEMMYKQITSRMDRMYKPAAAAEKEAVQDPETPEEARTEQQMAAEVEDEAGQQAAGQAEEQKALGVPQAEADQPTSDEPEADGTP